jgi:hypothetical protein
MRKIFSIFAIVLLTAEAAFALEAGSARVEITPPLGTPLNGYGDRLGRESLSVHDPLFVRCLYLNDGQTSVFVLTSDLCIMNRELRARVLELAPKEVPGENIILTATHTHSAQGGMIQNLLFRVVSGRYCPEVLEQTAQRFAEAMRAAYDSRKRAAIGYGSFEQHDLSSNRRVDKGPIDTQVGVIRVDDGDGNPLAIIANFAAHPTTVSDKDLYLISADYPGFFYSHLEQLVGGACVAMFMNGAEANQRPTNPENKSDSWARTESLGRLLAERVKATSDKIKCADLKLRVGSSKPETPRTIASTIAFSSTTFQTLEIGDLIVDFMPGEACAEIGLELRKRALARGYAAQFTVDLSNDYLGYFVIPAYYPHLYYENAMNFYGPFSSEWVYREFSKLMTRGTPDAEPPASEPARVVEMNAARSVVFTGTPREIGRKRGAAFREEIQAKYMKSVAEPLESGALLPTDSVWKKMPSFLNIAPFPLLTLAVGARPMLQGVSPQMLEELDGVAEGAELPFDAVWLTQALTVIGSQPKVDGLFRAPFCTMFATTGDRAGVDGLLVGRNLDWVGDEPPVISDVTPDSGHRFIQIGFSWNVGAFTGMNDAGVVLCAERVEARGVPSIDGAPVEFVLRELLQSSGTVEDAVAKLQAAAHLRGCHVLAAGPGRLGARVLEFGQNVVSRSPSNGLLLGADPGASNLDDETRSRYARVAESAANDHIIASGRIKAILADAREDVSGQASIWNKDTKHSVVFEPGARRLSVAFPDGSGRPGEFVTFSLKGDGK